MKCGDKTSIFIERYDRSDHFNQRSPFQYFQGFSDRLSGVKFIRNQRKFATEVPSKPPSENGNQSRNPNGNGSVRRTTGRSDQQPIGSSPNLQSHCQSEKPVENCHTGDAQPPFHSGKSSPGAESTSNGHSPAGSDPYGSICTPDGKFAAFVLAVSRICRRKVKSSGLQRLTNSCEL